MVIWHKLCQQNFRNVSNNILAVYNAVIFHAVHKSIIFAAFRAVHFYPKPTTLAKDRPFWLCTVHFHLNITIWRLKLF